MPESNREIIARYLQDAIAAESGFESQLRSFAQEGDDEEVQSSFAEHARQTASQIERLKLRLSALGEQPSMAKGFFAQFLALAPKAAQLTHNREERLTQNLIAAYSVEMSECAMYESLKTVATLAGDEQTVTLAESIAAEELQAAEKFWHFLRSRSKIAFNVLTAGEVDPAIETKAPDDRLLS